MTQKNIVLIGFMGAGKSLVSRRLEVLLKKERVSTDELIEKKEGNPVAEIFERQGEDYFRGLERKTVQEISKKKNLVIDCGGGIVLQEENIRDLKKNGTLFYLKTSPEIVYKRLKTQTNRPLLKVGDPLQRIKELLNQREKFYAQADITIDTDRHTIEDTTQEILKKLNDRNR